MAVKPNSAIVYGVDTVSFERRNNKITDKEPLAQRSGQYTLQPATIHFQKRPL